MRAAAGLAVALFVLGGCSALMGGFDPGGDFPSSSPIAAFSTGTATIAIKDGETIELDRVADGAGIDSVFGSTVRWTGPSGWHLTISGAGGDEEFTGGGGYLTLDLIADGQHKTTSFDGSRCVVDIDEADADGIGGSATCRGVKWYDAMDLTIPEVPEPLDDPKFDAEVTFEAAP